MTFPHCDIQTGQIYGCKKGSWAYWHEKGHLAFNNREETSRLKLWQSYLISFWMLAITLSIINKFMLIIALPLVLIYLGIEIYEEHWCNKYAKLSSR